MENGRPDRLTLAEQMPYGSVRVLARAGGLEGLGSGFFFVHRFPSSETHFVITNRHLVEGCEELEFQLHLSDANGKRILGPGIPVTELNPRVFFHPDPNVDLAAVAFSPLVNRLIAKGDRPYFIAFDESFLPTDEEIHSFDAFQKVVMVGYPDDIYDTHNNLPVARQGTTAVPPWFDFQGRQDLLIDIAVFEGSSGSALFVLREGLHNPGSVAMMGSRMTLVGVQYAGFSRDEHGSVIRTDGDGPPPDLKVAVRQMLNLAICVKAHRVRELIATAVPQLLANKET